MPPSVVPTNISRGLARAISMAEIGDPSNEPDTCLQRCPLLSVRHNRFEPAQSVLTPSCAEGSIPRTLKARWRDSRSEIWRGLTFFQFPNFHGLTFRWLSAWHHVMLRRTLCSGQG